MKAGDIFELTDNFFEKKGSKGVILNAKPLNGYPAFYPMALVFFNGQFVYLSDHSPIKIIGHTKRYDAPASEFKNIRCEIADQGLHEVS